MVSERGVECSAVEKSCTDFIGLKGLETEMWLLCFLSNALQKSSVLDGGKGQRKDSGKKAS